MTTDRARRTVPEASSRELLAWLVRRRHRLVVAGPSMKPTVQPGDVVLIDPRAYDSIEPSPGDVVVLRHPTRQDLRIVKRVDRIESGGLVRVLSDNLEVDGVDSRSFGPVAPTLVVGRVTSRIGR